MDMIIRLHIPAGISHSQQIKDSLQMVQPIIIMNVNNNPSDTGKGKNHGKKYYNCLINYYLYAKFVFVV